VQTKTLVGDARDTPTSRGIILPPIFTTLRGRFAASIAIVLKIRSREHWKTGRDWKISHLPLGEYHKKMTLYGFAIFWLHLNLLVAEPS
jgi:hypothetical protein